MYHLRILSTTACAAVLLPVLADASPIGDCYIGAYRLADSSVVDIAPSDAGTLRWRKFDGTTGVLHEAQAGNWSHPGLEWVAAPQVGVYE
jgi:hypothetical protein